MINDELVLRILNIPRTFFNPTNDNSVYSLLKQTGYFREKDKVDEKTIINILEQNPEYTEDWLDWSANKRSDAGWYFKVGDDKGYTLGYLDSEKGIIKQEDYLDARTVCAKYIILEIESIRSS
jgi:hypothetical protein